MAKFGWDVFEKSGKHDELNQDSTRKPPKKQGVYASIGLRMAPNDAQGRRILHIQDATKLDPFTIDFVLKLLQNN